MKPPFANLKSVVLALIIAGLMFASGFIAAKTLLLTETPLENSGGAGVNATSGQPTLNTGSGDASVKVGSADSRVSSDNASVTVWVNTDTGVYHCPKTRWYGNTKNGKYMTQKEAQSKGYRPAYGTVCG